MRILFDRSAFHKERFDLLQQSRLLQLTQDGKVLVFYTTVLIEETVRTVQSERVKSCCTLFSICAEDAGRGRFQRWISTEEDSPNMPEYRGLFDEAISQRDR
jgi:hypothetical protein